MSVQSFIKLGLLAVSASACLASTAFAAGGEPAGVGAAMASDVVKIEAAGVARKLINTYSATANGSGSALLASTFNLVDASVVNCTNAAGCHIGLEAMAQVAPAGGDWAICLYVDGLSVACPYQGVNGVGTFVVGNYRGFSGLVSQGLHNVEMRVFPNVAASLYRWNVDYRVYKN